MGPWAHRKLFWIPPPCFPHPRLSHRTTGPPRAQKPHGLCAKPLCFSLLPSAPVTQPLDNFCEPPKPGGEAGLQTCSGHLQTTIPRAPPTVNNKHNHGMRVALQGKLQSVAMPNNQWATGG